MEGERANEERRKTPEELETRKNELGKLIEQVLPMVNAGQAKNDEYWAYKTELDEIERQLKVKHEFGQSISDQEKYGTSIATLNPEDRWRMRKSIDEFNKEKPIE